VAVTAESVVVELIAKTDGYAANINGAAGATTTAMSRIEQAASRAEVQIVRSSGAMANAQRNLGRQIADIGTQLAGGQSPFLILAQQAPQVADALADTGGKAATVAAFFAGPWGAALLAAGSAIAVLAEKALKGGDTIESLTAKLQDNAVKAQLTAQAQAIFERSLFGSAQASAELNKRLQEQNRSQIQVAQSALAAAVALRQQNLQNLRAEASKAAIAQGNVESQRNRALNPSSLLTPEERTAALGAAAGYSRQLIDARKRVTVANKALADSESAVVEARIPLLNLSAAAASDRSAAAASRHTTAVDGLATAYRKASAEARRFPVGDPRRAQALERANQAYIQGAAGANRTLDADQEAIRASNRKGPKGPSAETLARRAEVQRIREVRNNEAFNNELEQLNGQIIAAQRERAITAEDIARFDREAVERQFRDRQDNIAADLSARKYSGPEAAALNEKNEEVRLLRLRNIAIDEDMRAIQQAASHDSLMLDLQSDQLESDRSIAESRDEQRRIDLDLVRLKYEQRRIALTALRAAAATKGDTNAVGDITRQIDALPGLQRNEETAIGQRNRGRFEQYRRSLSGADEIQNSINGIKIDTLEAVTDELTNATTAALGLKGAFGQIVGELIRIGIQRRFIGPLADGLFGKADGSTSGSVGGLLASFASSLGGRASGGYVAPGQLVRVNEAASPGRVEGFRPVGGGTVIPLGQMSAARPAGGTTIVNQSFNLDARYGITTPELLSYVQQTARTEGTRAGGAAFVASQRSAPGTLAKYNQLEG